LPASGWKKQCFIAVVDEGIIVMLLLPEHWPKSGDFETTHAPSEIRKPQDREALSPVFQSSEG
jgi:hypothetical protein